MKNKKIQGQIKTNNIYNEQSILHYLFVNIIRMKTLKEYNYIFELYNQKKIDKGNELW